MPAPSHHNLLLADDEEVIRELFQRALASLGHPVATAGNGRQALEIFHRDPGEWKAVILDCYMPEGNGDEVLREMRQVRPELPALLISGHGVKGIDGTAEGFGKCLFVIKPVTIGHLVGKLEELLIMASEAQA